MIVMRENFPYVFKGGPSGRHAAGIRLPASRLAASLPARAGNEHRDTGEHDEARCQPGGKQAPGAPATHWACPIEESHRPHLTAIETQTDGAPLCSVNPSRTNLLSQKPPPPPPWPKVATPATPRIGSVLLPMTSTCLIRRQ